MDVHSNVPNKKLVVVLRDENIDSALMGSKADNQVVTFQEHPLVLVEEAIVQICTGR